MSCDCRKFAPDPNCDRPGHTAPEQGSSSPAAYEEELRLQRNLYDELSSQTEQLRVDRQRAVDALEQIAAMVTLPNKQCQLIAQAALLKLGETL